MGTQLPPKRGTAPKFLAYVCCGQMAECIKMPLGTDVGLGPRHIVLDGVPASPARKGAQQPLHFLAHVCCGQMVGHLSKCWALVTLCIKRSLVTVRLLIWLDIETVCCRICLRELLCCFHCRLADLGQHVGTRILDVLVVRERGFKRETKLLQILIFVKSTLWKVVVFPNLIYYLLIIFNMLCYVLYY